MATNQEQIEARLCDYVEGTLTDAERADIEKHLASNPQHRKLIAELLKTKNLVRQLPRVKAPADVSETLQGQLERSVLLGAMPDDLPDTSMRIGFASRLRAIAAVLFLAVGLGAVMVYMLRNTRTLPELATLPPKADSPAIAMTQPLASAGELAASTPAAPSPPDGSVAVRRTESDVTSTTSVASTSGKPSSDSGGAVVPAAIALASNAFANNAPPPAPGASGGGSGSATAMNDTLFGTALVERAKASAGTNSFVCFVADASDKEVVGYLDHNQIAYTVEPAPEPLSLAPNQLVRGARYDERTARLESRPIPPIARDRGAAQAEANNPAANGVFGPTSSPSTAPSEMAEGAAKRQSDAKTEAQLRDLSVAGIPTTAPLVPQAMVEAAANEAMRSQKLIVARQVTKQQAADLRCNFTRAGQLQKQQSAQNVVQPGLQEAAGPKDKDGLAVAGSEVKALPSTRPADELTLTPSISAETTQPAPAPPATQPSDNALALEAGSTPTTLPADQRVDVFIVVDSPPADVPPTTAPSTQPALIPTTGPTTAPSNPQ